MLSSWYCMHELCVKYSMYVGLLKWSWLSFLPEPLTFQPTIYQAYIIPTSHGVKVADRHVEKDRQPIDWSIYQVTFPDLITRPLILMKKTFLSFSLSSSRLTVCRKSVSDLYSVQRAVFQFVVVNPTNLPDTLAFYTETKKISRVWKSMICSPIW